MVTKFQQVHYMLIMLHACYRYIILCEESLLQDSCLGNYFGLDRSCRTSICLYMTSSLQYR